MVTLRNDNFEVTLIEEGGQIHSAKNLPTGIEYIHDGINGWGQQNPLLFPMISNTLSKEQLINGKTYHMSNHGVVRRALFSVESFDATHATLVKKADDATLALFPFNFELRVDYTLENDGIAINYTVINHDAIEMPFQFGLHPAFKCPLTSDHNYSDYTIEFEKEETKKGLIGQFELNGKSFALNHGLFEKAPTILFDKVNSTWVQMSDGDHGVRVSLNGFDHIAFWTPDTASLLCIEPWCGHGDLGGEQPCEFKDRDCTKVVAPNSSWAINVKYTLF